MKKRIYLMLTLIIFVGLLCVSTQVFGYDTTKKLYQQITINTDGSITIKEAALLSGTYNGREREIYFKNNSATKFTGIYSNFSGNTDIYNGSSIKDIKIYDISQKNFNSIKDINKVEKEYKEVKSASKGKYGVYTIENHSYGADFRIYCPSKEQKVFCMEYTITDAVVVHNDIAELYWNVIGENYRENITDFQVMVYLPKSDNNLRVWTHGPLSGTNQIIDNKTVYFKDSDVSAKEAETIRIMFNKNVVPNATKKSGVDGKNYILEYEQKMADSANYEREQKILDQVNHANDSVISLENYPSMYKYNYALQATNKVQDISQKQALLQRIENQKDKVNEQWKKGIDNDISSIKKYSYMLNKENIRILEREQYEGFDNEAKVAYNKEVQVIKQLLEIKNANIRKTTLIIVIMIYIALTIMIIYIISQLKKEKNKFDGEYYRDFPSEDRPYIIEYLMKKNITDNSISATILDLIARKIVKMEEMPKDKKNVKFILQDKTYIPTEAEKFILKIMFEIAGSNNECTLKQIKNVGKTESGAKKLTKKINEFKADAKKEARQKKYFKENNMNTIPKVIIVLVYIITMFCMIGVFKESEQIKNAIMWQIIYVFAIHVICIIYFIIVSKYRARTEIGQEEYAKWLAHKRFLKDFSTMDEKDLPEIILWEKYLVTATILGEADKVEKRMKMNITNFSDTTYMNNLLLSTTINAGIRQSINTAYSSMSSSSSYSSGGGFGGGSSGFGGRRWPEVEAEDASKNSEKLIMNS